MTRQSLAKFFDDFRGDARGAVAIIFGFTLLGLIVASGMAIDVRAASGWALPLAQRSMRQCSRVSKVCDCRT